MTPTVDFSCFEKIEAIFKAEDYFLTATQTKEWQSTEPLKDLTILHNMPLYDNTLLKIKALLLAGAKLIISAPRNIPPSHSAVEFIKGLGLPFIPEPCKINIPVDIVLDCSADYATLATPRLGVIEVTGTGRHYFQTHSMPYPVIAVDDSQLKEFETALGTGDGCLRALYQWLPQNFSEKMLILFGFGKVGKGITQALRPVMKQLIIVEANPSKVSEAQAQGLTAYHIADPDLEPRLYQAFAMITATGEEGTITQHFKNKGLFQNAYLINMGVHDEYGSLFNNEEVLFHKQGLNFSLPEPTRLKYIDPIFYAHNLGAVLLASKQFEPGYHAFPSTLDHAIIQKWQNFHGEKL